MNGDNKELNINFVKTIRNKLKAVIRGDKPMKSTLLRPDERSGLGGLWQSLSKSYYDALQEAQARIDKYIKYDFLDKNLAEATAGLNTYADNIVSGAIGGEESYKVVIDEATEKAELIEEVIRKLEERSGIKDQIWEIARDMMCVGDEFSEVVIGKFEDGKEGIDRLKKLPEKEMYADVDDRGVFKDEDFPYYQRPSVYARKKIPFDSWRIIHFKVGSDVYGVDRSLFANASLRIGQQLLWLDDSIVLARMSRACQRFAYNIDVSDIPPQDRIEYVKQWLDDLKSEEVVNAITGEIDVLKTPPLPDQDLAIPVQKDSPQGIQVLSGDTNLSRIGDVEYMETKFFMAIGMPKAYASREEGVSARATLQQIDIQFARQVRRRQQALRPGLRKFYETEFLLNGIDPDSFSWNVVFPILGTMDEMLKWEMEKTKAEIAKILTVDVGTLNDLWVLEEILGYDEEKIKRYARIFPTTQEKIDLTPEMAAIVKRDPQLRMMFSDMKALIDWQVEREAELENKKPVGINRKTSVSDDWR